MQNDNNRKIDVYNVPAEIESGNQDAQKKLEPLAIPGVALCSIDEPTLPKVDGVEYCNQFRSAQSSTTENPNDFVPNVEPTGVGAINIQPETSPEVANGNITHSLTCMISIRSVGSICCRICHNTDGNNRLISPCLCKGTLAYVHRSCLEHWLSTSGMVHCELCQYRYPTEETLRYTFCQSIRIWYKHPNNRGLLQADFLVCSLLTVVTFGLVAICMFGLQYFNLQSYRLGVSRLWTQGSIILFLVIVIFAYCINLFLIIKSQIVPWYRWWQSARQVKLIFIDRRPANKVALRKKIRDVERELQSTTLSVRTDEGNSTILVAR